jgi:hypothetical protein
MCTGVVSVSACRSAWAPRSGHSRAPCAAPAGPRRWQSPCSRAHSPPDARTRPRAPATRRGPSRPAPARSRRRPSVRSPIPATTVRPKLVDLIVSPLDLTRDSPLLSASHRCNEEQLRATPDTGHSSLRRRIGDARHGHGCVDYALIPGTAWGYGRSCRRAVWLNGGRR